MYTAEALLTCRVGDTDNTGTLLGLLCLLAQRNYDFVTTTPLSHARVLARPDKVRAVTVRDVFGWSLPFDAGVLDPKLHAAAATAGVLAHDADGFRVTVRVSQIHGQLLLHSAYPTTAVDAVFLGPDSQKFADFIAAELEHRGDVRRIVDLGTGSGVAGIVAGLGCPAAQVTLADINPRALQLARINAHHAGIDAEVVESDAFGNVGGPVDLALANPPFMADSAGRRYRDGGDMHGARLSLDWALAAGRRLNPGGRFLMYTGAAIVDGRDALRAELAKLLPEIGCDVIYREVDPYIFGDELEGEGYRNVERIAAVTAVITRHAR